MTKKEWLAKIQAWSAETQLPSTRLQAVVDATIETIGPALKEEGRLVVPGLGTFKVSTRKARTGKHPRTGEVMKMKASKTVTFRAAPALRRAV